MKAASFGTISSLSSADSIVRQVEQYQSHGGSGAELASTYLTLENYLAEVDPRRQSRDSLRAWVRDRYGELLADPHFGLIFEPALAPVFVFKYGFWGFLLDARTAAKLLRKGRLPLIPSKIRRRGDFRRMVGKIIPLAGVE